MWKFEGSTSNGLVATRGTNKQTNKQTNKHSHKVNNRKKPFSAIVIVTYFDYEMIAAVSNIEGLN